MRKSLLIASFTVGIAVAFMPSIGQAQMMGGYGGGGYGPGYMMGPGYGRGGYGPGYMMGPGYGEGYGYGPGMMYGYGPDGQHYYSGGSQRYRGKQLCWHQTGADQNTGYYGACSK